MITVKCIVCECGIQAVHKGKRFCDKCIHIYIRNIHLVESRLKQSIRAIAIDISKQEIKARAKAQLTTSTGSH